MTSSDAALAEFRQREDARRAAAYARDFVPVTSQVVPVVIDALGPVGGAALDLGCGDGTMARTMATAGWRVVGVDRSPAMCRLAAQRGVEVCQADATALPLATASVHAVTSIFLLPHLEDPQAGLLEARRVLDGGGRLVTAGWAEPALAPFTGLLSDLIAKIADDPFDDLARLSVLTKPDAVREMTLAAGFSQVSVQTVPMLARFASADHWWRVLMGSSSGAAALFQAQPTETRQSIRDQFHREAGAYVGGGELAVPACAVVAVANR